VPALNGQAQGSAPLLPSTWLGLNLRVQVPVLMTRAQFIKTDEMGVNWGPGVAGLRAVYGLRLTGF
jgi:hypothetical protein